MIETTQGLKEESELRKVTGAWDNDNEFGDFVEYYIGDELVHRSATVNLKEGFIGGVMAGQLGG